MIVHKAGPILLRLESVRMFPSRKWTLYLYIVKAGRIQALDARLPAHGQRSEPERESHSTVLSHALGCINVAHEEERRRDCQQ